MEASNHATEDENSQYNERPTGATRVRWIIAVNQNCKVIDLGKDWKDITNQEYEDRVAAALPFSHEGE